jgi:hypothetical protein
LLTLPMEKLNILKDQLFDYPIGLIKYIRFKISEGAF